MRLSYKHIQTQYLSKKKNMTRTFNDVHYVQAKYIQTQFSIQKLWLLRGFNINYNHCVVFHQIHSTLQQVMKNKLVRGCKQIHETIETPPVGVVQ